MAEFSFGGIDVKYDGTEEVLRALENAVNRGLKVCGEKAVEYAKEKCPRSDINHVHLQDKINYQVDGDKCYIGVERMPVPYGIYVEFGTGKYAEEGGRQTPWVYADSEGNFHTTSGRVATPFIRPAAQDHNDEYKSIIKDSLQNA